jgi:SM-20-related protein
VTARFRLAPAIDRAALAARFGRERRVRIAPFLVEEDAAALAEHLLARDDWKQVLNSGDKVFEMDRSQVAALDPAQAARLDAAVHASARDGFQFRFGSIRIPDEDAERAADGRALADFARFMSGPEVLGLMGEVIGPSDIAFADAQATRYGPGDFLTAHDDEVAGKNRRAAYVFGLSRDWRAEWGGLLLFHEAGGEVAGFAPQFNALNLFAVPQPHSVSLVAPFAPRERLSVTGWLRARA